VDNYKYESFQICLHLSLDYDERIFFRLLQKLIGGPLIELVGLCTLLFDSIHRAKERSQLRDIGGREEEGKK